MSHDLFISYRHSSEEDQEAIRNFVPRLREKGLDVFVDESGVRHFDYITETIRGELGDSKALLVYFSKDYLASRACLWELTSAFIASQKGGGDPRERIFIVTPDDGPERLKQLPAELRDAESVLNLGSGLDGLPGLVGRLGETFQELGAMSSQEPNGRSLSGSLRFVGRTREMWDLHSLLNLSGCAIVSSGVSGMGGIGKSLLAEEYAMRFGAAYPGGVFWLEAQGSFNSEAPEIEAFEAACAEQFLKIVRGCGENPPPDAPFEVLQSLLRRIIEKEGKPCLWVVDDIPCGLSGHLEAVKKWLSPHDLVRTLVTTRSREYYEIGAELPIDLLDAQSAQELLARHEIDVEKEENAATKLIERLGGHALGLDIAGASIANSLCTVERYLEKLDEEAEASFDVSSELAGALPAGCERSIFRAIEQGFSRLGDAGHDFLRLAANLSPAPIHADFVESVFGCADKLEKLESWKRARLGVLGCRKLSLARQVGDSWQIHALVSAIVRHRGEASDERASRLRGTAIERLSAMFRPELQYEDSKLIAAALEHARFLTFTIRGEDDLSLLRRLALFDHYRGNRRLAVEDWRRLIGFEEERSGPNHPDTLTALSNLASTLWNIGDHIGAKKLQEQVLERQKKVLGPDHPSTLTAMNNLASSFWKMGDHFGAKKLEEQVLERQKEILGQDHPSTLTSMNNLASTLRNMGDHGGAKKLQEQVLERRKETLGPEHPSATVSAWNLFVTLNEAGDQTGALRIVSDNLLWLLEDSATVHDGVQRRIREMLQG